MVFETYHSRLIINPFLLRQFRRIRLLGDRLLGEFCFWWIHLSDVPLIVLKSIRPVSDLQASEFYSTVNVVPNPAGIPKGCSEKYKIPVDFFSDRNFSCPVRVPWKCAPPDSLEIALVQHDRYLWPTHYKSLQIRNNTHFGRLSHRIDDQKAGKSVAPLDDQNWLSITHLYSWQKRSNLVSLPLDIVYYYTRLFSIQKSLSFLICYRSVISLW